MQNHMDAAANRGRSQAEPEGSVANAGELRPEAGARLDRTRRPPAVVLDEDDEGILFLNRDGTAFGAIRLDGETFQCTIATETSSKGLTYWALSGRGDRGDAVTGALFKEKFVAGGSRPQLSGRVTTVVGQGKRRFAGWVRASKGSAFYSLKASRLPEDRGTLDLFPDLPAQRAPTSLPTLA